MEWAASKMPLRIFVKTLICARRARRSSHEPKGRMARTQCADQTRHRSTLYPSLMPIIEVDHVTKEYKLGQLTSLKQTLLNSVNRLAGRPVEERKPFKALDDVHFSVEPGEVLGIIGHNGAGKSTLLKLLANIAQPSSGSIRCKGKIAPLIEVGAGLVPDLTGRENIFLNGAILGIPKEEIERKFDDIVAFAELEEFIDTPIKRYSSGMQVRLGFSIATSVESDILIVDEVLAVGDLAFQRKCFDHMEESIKRQKKTVLLVSHNIRQVERLCTRVILLRHGKVAAMGNPVDVCNMFYEESDKKIQQQIAAKAPTSLMSQGAELLSLRFVDDEGQELESIPFQGDLIISCVFRVKQRINRPVLGFGIHTTDFVYLANNDTQKLFRDNPIDAGEIKITCRVKVFPFNAGVYSLRMGLADGESMIFYGENLGQIRVVSHELSMAYMKEAGYVPLDTQWAVEEMN